MLYHPVGLRLEISGLRFQALDAFRPRWATWAGQVMFSPLGPSWGPFMTHLLLGGGFRGVYGARSPGPPRLPPFATPRSVCYKATRLQALTHYFVPLMHGCPACWRRRARATGLMPVGPP